MRPASVFARQTRTNQPSWAAAPATGTPISSATRVRHKECTHLSSRAIEPYRVSQPQIRRPAPDHFRDQDSYTTRKMAGLIQIKVRRHGTGTLIDRGAGDEG